MKIVFDVGGSILCPKGIPDEETISGYSKLFLSLLEEGHEIVVVVGGGKLVKDFIAVAEKFSDDRDFLDNIGIQGTRLNAMALASSLGEHVYKRQVPDIDTLKKVVGMKKIVVMGGLKPKQTTDTVAVQAAEALSSDLIIIGTDVDGVYDKDPKKHRSAKMFIMVAPSQIEEIMNEEKFTPGHSAVIDPTAVRIMKRTKIKTLVMNGRDLENMRNAIRGREFLGTTIEG